MSVFDWIMTFILFPVIGLFAFVLAVLFVICVCVVLIIKQKLFE